MLPAHAGEVLVCDETCMQVFAVDGTFVRCLHQPSGDEKAFDEPWGVAVMPSADVGVCDFYNAYGSIYVEPAGHAISMARKY